MGIDIRTALKNAEKNGDFFNDFAVEVAERTYQMRPAPVLQIGDTGWGKTKLARFISNLANLEFIGVNAYPGMDITQLIGMWRPKNNEGNIEVVWEDGLLTQAVRKGALFALEEITRLPRKMQGRLLGILDTENRYYSLPEAGMGEIEVNDDFWLLATANPMGGGYDTASLDRALTRRFGAIFSVDQPLCDEERKFKYELEKYFDEEFANDRTERLMKWLGDVRQNNSTKVNTGEVVQLIKNSSFAPIKEAASWTIAPKYKDASQIMSNLDAHFSTEDDSEKHKLTKTKKQKPVAKQVTEQTVPTLDERKEQTAVSTPVSNPETVTDLASKMAQALADMGFANVSEKGENNGS